MNKESFLNPLEGPRKAVYGGEVILLNPRVRGETLVAEELRGLFGEKYALRYLEFKDGKLQSARFSYPLDTEGKLNLNYDMDGIVNGRVEVVKISFVDSNCQASCYWFGKAIYYQGKLLSVNSGRTFEVPEGIEEDFAHDILGSDWRDIIGGVARRVISEEGFLEEEKLRQKIFKALSNLYLEEMFEISGPKLRGILDRDSRRSRESFVIFKNGKNGWHLTGFEDVGTPDMTRPVRLEEWVEYDELNYRLVEENDEFVLTTAKLSGKTVKTLVFPAMVTPRKVALFLEKKGEEWFNLREEFKARLELPSFNR